MNLDQQQNPASAQPIHDIAPQPGAVGNSEQVASIPVKQAPAQMPSPDNSYNAGNATATAPIAEESKNEDLDKVLKDVNKDVKAADRKPSGPAKPYLVIAFAVFAAIGLCAAAYYAYKQSV